MGQAKTTLFARPVLGWPMLAAATKLMSAKAP
jgi:hypothetical protein